MKIGNFTYDNNNYIGIVESENSRVLPFNRFNSSVISDINTINELIEIYDEKIEMDIINELAGGLDGWIPLNNVKFEAPIPYPKRNIICLGKNYMDHAKETKGLPGGSEEDIPKFPIYFAKVANPAIGDGDIIRSYESITNKVDYEVELAIIVGKEGRDISRENAEDHIFGYTIVNDISARNIQRKHGQWFKGKSLDTYCPMGPYIVCKDEIKFPLELDIKCSINGEVRQDSNTRELIFDVPHIIEDLSKGMTLLPGDIIITGTPSGVGLGFKPFKFLKIGDEIKCYVEKIGHLYSKYE